MIGCHEVSGYLNKKKQLFIVTLLTSNKKDNTMFAIITLAVL